MAVASLLMLSGATGSAMLRRLSPWAAIASLVMAAWLVFARSQLGEAGQYVGPVAITGMSEYVKLLSYGVGALLVLLQWPTDRAASGNSSLFVGREGPEYFGLMLLAFAGVSLVAGADDLILLFLGVELASIPTYIMLSISRPLAVAQEATLKYFFLGAFSAALTLFGLSFLFGVSGSLSLGVISQTLAANMGSASPWVLLATITIVVGLAFKLAAFPMHFYAPDVYTGAATPMTALLSFVPKTAGLVALIKVLFAVRGAPEMAMAPSITTLLWIVAVLSMTIGNVLGLMQHNIKRMMACSSIAHSGYMLTGVLVALSSGGNVQIAALQGVLFYLTAYGLMNAGVFAVLMMIPAKVDPFAYEGKVPPATSAETFAELTGTGRRDPMLGLIMAVCCFSLIGIPLTIGFFGKLLLIRPALMSHYYWLVIILVINAAISAGYYLRVVAAMFLREPRALETTAGDVPALESPALMRTFPLLLAGLISAGGCVLLGTILPATSAVLDKAKASVSVLPVFHVTERANAFPSPENTQP